MRGFLTVSPKATYSVYPDGGARLMFGLNESSPFRMRIKYPQGSSTCAPGALVSSEKDAGYIIETYESQTQNIPTFSFSFG